MPGSTNGQGYAALRGTNRESGVLEREGVSSADARVGGGGGGGEESEYSKEEAKRKHRVPMWTCSRR